MIKRRFLFALALAALPSHAVCAPQEAPAVAPAVASPDAGTCDASVSEIAEGEDRVRALQAQLHGAGVASEQNARNGQAIAQGAHALSWATGIASLIPGVGFVASAAGGASTQQAIQANQQAAAATNRTMQDVVSELVPLSQRMHGLRQAAEARGCVLPPAPPQ